MRRNRLALWSSALAVLLAGCGGQGTDRDDAREPGPAPAVLAALREARAATAAAGSATVDSVSVVEGTRTAAKGSLDWRGRLRGRLKVTVVKGDGPTEFRVSDDAYYVRLHTPVRGRHWASYPHDTADRLAPYASLDLLLDAADAHHAGRARIRGVIATHWAGTVHAAESAVLRAAGIRKQTVDLWADSRGRLVKRVESGTGRDGVITTTTYWSDFGTDVPTVAAPPAGDRLTPGPRK
ncbi:hypothetical protein [Streptomyces tsukubensis]|uniref:Lipoprotein n=1 Tax=Streptomyces tsukubensis TaxID=83656 RepID=A0A1V4A8T2_9ACTN|nr:hypothetical protein [Streptomyces tsukubensis]OON78460.1 hypothetical protein B1H18_16985 [Streptomyces tsukubensis]QFR95224.1 hypothetical protein GBW32_22150 [Streptomyces tsukubensis]